MQESDFHFLKLTRMSRWGSFAEMHVPKIPFEEASRSPPIITGQANFWKCCSNFGKTLVIKSLPEGLCMILQGISNNWSMTKQIYKTGNVIQVYINTKFSGYVYFKSANPVFGTKEWFSFIF